MSRDAHSPHGAAGDERQYFFDKPGNVRLVFGAFYVLCAVLVVLDFVVHRHEVHPFEHLTEFYPLYGFVGITVLVLLAKLLRRVAGRPEDYYDVD